MRLFYRSVSYDHVLAPIGMTESNAQGQYRGCSFHFVYPRHVPVTQPGLKLKYRGVAYQTTATGGASAIPSATRAAETATRDVSQPGSISQNRLALQTRYAISNEVAKVHRQNVERSLQHRLEVAKSRGDQNLVSILEREMQQSF